MNATGRINITEDLMLINPTLDITKVVYDFINHTVSIECLFKEGAYEHSRTFVYLNDGKTSLTIDDIYTFLANDPVLGVFS